MAFRRSLAALLVCVAAAALASCHTPTPPDQPPFLPWPYYVCHGNCDEVSANSLLDDIEDAIGKSAYLATRPVFTQVLLTTLAQCRANDKPFPEGDDVHCFRVCEAWKAATTGPDNMDTWERVFGELEYGH